MKKVRPSKVVPKMRQLATIARDFAAVLAFYAL